MTKEDQRLQESEKRIAHWKRWGPYLSERAWGTVREDYSPGGTAWEFFSHDDSRSRVYRWNEDGLAGICDRHQRICMSVALWNGKDGLLKERLYGLTGNEGNHGEDVKECYFYLDSTPTHSWMQYLYKYPQAAFPYAKLREENQRRGRNEAEYELTDTGVFDESRYFDVLVEYAKAGPEDILMSITATNRGPEAARLDVLPTIWFRNTWAWRAYPTNPILWQSEKPEPGAVAMEMECKPYGHRVVHFEGSPELLFCENETNYKRLYGLENASKFVKDGINDYVVDGCTCAVNPEHKGTKGAAHYRLELGPGESAKIRVRFAAPPKGNAPVFPAFGPTYDQAFEKRRLEADEFYASVTPHEISEDAKKVMRQAFAGMLWSKQFYHYVIKDWLDGDPGHPPPPASRKHGRNHEWTHLYNADVISMPDKWEYPWYAAWDLAFHTVPLALIDPDFAKEQLMLMVREWYMHPNGQLPAYEWAFGDVNPPVHAWAAWRVYKIEKKRTGHGDRVFLARIFHKLLLNFTWWVNRKDANGRNVFQGGFLGLDNIGVFDRSAPLPTGGHIEQADGTGWMAMYSLNLLAIAMELAKSDPSFEDVASKFWEHFLYIATAINQIGDEGTGMWHEEDGFYYDVLHMPGGAQLPLQIRSMVGLIPLFAVETLESDLVESLPGFKRRLDWFIKHRRDLTKNVASMSETGEGARRLMSVVTPDQLRRILKVMLDENEFLSPYGIRSLSRIHQNHPYTLAAGDNKYRVKYDPAESTTGVFGGNSNWRGPIWFPVNYLLIESLQKFHHYVGPEFQVECPTGSGQMMTLMEVAAEISHRLNRLFLKDEHGARPINNGSEMFRDDPNWRDLVQFYEYFHGDSGAGLGANHQTGWTGLAAKLIQQSGS